MHAAVSLTVLFALLNSPDSKPQGDAPDEARDRACQAIRQLYSFPKDFWSQTETNHYALNSAAGQEDGTVQDPAAWVMQRRLSVTAVTKDNQRHLLQRLSYCDSGQPPRPESSSLWDGSRSWFCHGEESMSWIIGTSCEPMEGHPRLFALNPLDGVFPSSFPSIEKLIQTADAVEVAETDGLWTIKATLEGGLSTIQVRFRLDPVPKFERLISEFFGVPGTPQAGKLRLRHDLAALQWQEENGWAWPMLAQLDIGHHTDFAEGTGAWQQSRVLIKRLSLEIQPAVDPAEMTRQPKSGERISMPDKELFFTLGERRIVLDGKRYDLPEPLNHVPLPSEIDALLKQARPVVDEGPR